MKKLLLTLVVVCIALPVFAGGGQQKQDAGSAGSGGELRREIRFSWWGNETRNNATIEAIKKPVIIPGTISSKFWPMSTRNRAARPMVCRISA